jgi:hypothetical protein
MKSMFFDRELELVDMMGLRDIWHNPTEFGLVMETSNAQVAADILASAETGVFVPVED